MGVVSVKRLVEPFESEQRYAGFEAAEIERPGFRTVRTYPT